MELFEATTFDLKELALLFDQYRQFYKQTTDIAACLDFLTERLQKQDAVIYIAKNETAIIGFVQLYPLFSSVQLKRMWQLNDLFVIESARRSGVARLLIDRSKQLAIQTNASCILLETGKNNKEGNALYPSAGFEMATTNFYYWKNKTVA